MMAERIIWRLVGEMLMIYVNKVEPRSTNFAGSTFLILFFFVPKTVLHIGSLTQKLSSF